MSPELLRALLTVVAGSLAGGLTNTLAVWMLFHPYRPLRLGPGGRPLLQGAIPKNQDRLAAAVGRTVGTRLLTEDDLTRIFSNREFREAFEDRLGGFLEEMLERERGSLRDTLPAPAIREVESVLDGIARQLCLRLDGWLDSADFQEAVDRRTAEVLDRLADRPVGELLTPEREETLAGALEEWIGEAVARDGFERVVDDYLARAVEGVLRDDRTLEGILPGGLAQALEGALARFLPVAARRLGGILEDPEARIQLEAALRDLFKRFLRDLRFHQRLVARLVVTDETLDRVLTTLEEDGAEQLSLMLRDPAVQEAIARRVNDGVLDLLRRPVTEVVGRPDDLGVQRGRQAVSSWVVRLVRDPETRSYLTDKLRQGVGRTARGTWGDLLRSVPRERITRSVVAVGRSEPARELYRQALKEALLNLLDRPLGRPAALLPEGGRERLQEAAADPLWIWLQAQVPEVVRTLDVQRRVEEKVRAYPVKQMEELVRRVTDRELRLIVRLGYVLGGGIGAILVAVNHLI